MCSGKQDTMTADRQGNHSCMLLLQSLKEVAQLCFTTSTAPSTTVTVSLTECADVLAAERSGLKLADLRGEG